MLRNTLMTPNIFSFGILFAKHSTASNGFTLNLFCTHRRRKSNLLNLAVMSFLRNGKNWIFILFVVFFLSHPNAVGCQIKMREGKQEKLFSLTLHFNLINAHKGARKISSSENFSDTHLNLLIAERESGGGR